MSSRNATGDQVLHSQMERQVERQPVHRRRWAPNHKPPAVQARERTPSLHRPLTQRPLPRSQLQPPTALAPSTKASLRLLLQVAEEQEAAQLARRPLTTAPLAHPLERRGSQAAKASCQSPPLPPKQHPV